MNPNRLSNLAEPQRNPPSNSEMCPAVDPLDLYELCVQSPDRDVALLRAIHGTDPRTLGEDFSGTAALSREWVRALPRGRAVAVDHDANVLARASDTPRLTTVHGDVLDCTQRADVIFVGNFSIGEWHDRLSLINYLRHARSRIRPGGVFVCDLYGGVDAYQRGTIKEERLGPAGERITYTWEQRHADPTTGRVVNALHFAVKSPRRPRQMYHDAFVYHWRLWSIPELRDAMLEAGFAATQVYHRFAHAVDQDGEVHVQPLGQGEELEPAYFVFIVGRTRRPPRAASRSSG
ncbi:MAG: hypothetical protein KF866_11900 [Phycisphaeraceae bacterium]|nr:hypothetical protein [Phycisphaeraceae bacterium]